MTVRDHRVYVEGTSYVLGTAPSTPLELGSIVPTILPSSWEERDARPIFPERAYGRRYQGPSGLLVLLTASIEADRKRWLHISISHRGGRYPTWPELSAIKDLFCGTERTAYQVHPPSSQHVNIHQKCLHLWCPLDGPVTPDFTRGGETI